MFNNLPFFPEEASTIASRVDLLYLFLVVVSVFFSLLIAGLVIFFAIKYRRRSETEIPKPITGSNKLETLWTVIPFMLTMVMFAWGASVFFTMSRPPAGAMDVYVVGKQWMWKFQHATGQREIDELHVPVGRAVRLTMASEDVIHSFFVPAFRMKADVVPGRWRTAWFQATKPGTYHLFCAEYCGTRHAGMIGQVVVMEPSDFEAWLGGGRSEGSPAELGQKLFQDLACYTCHKPDATGRGPVLVGLFGKKVNLENGQTLTADEDYIRDSILNPQAKIVAGFQPIMPTFQGQISEEGLLQLVAYIKSLGTAEPNAAQTPPMTPANKQATNPNPGTKQP